MTRGPKGMALFSPGEAPVYCRATVREVADVSGAGDTAIATLAASVGKGLPWASAGAARVAAQVARRVRETRRRVGMGSLGLEGCRWDSKLHAVVWWR